MNGLFRFYADEARTKEIQASEVRFPTVKAGKRVMTRVFIQNALDEPVMLSGPNTSDEDFRIISFPKALGAKEGGVIEFEYTPKPDRIKSLKDAKWEFKEVQIG